MTDPPLEDHVVGIELQIVELVERRERATVQGEHEEAARYQAEIDALQAELATSADELAEALAEHPDDAHQVHGVHEPEHHQ